MKTNASAKTIIKAVENVSASMYDNNVIFRKYPEKITKNVLRFTLRTKDANKAGSLQSKDGHKQPKANWEVHENVMREIFELNPRNNIYVDTLYGRQFNNSPAATSQVELLEEEQEEALASVEPPVQRQPNGTPTAFTRRGVLTKVVRLGGKFATTSANATKRLYAKTKRPYTKKNGLPNMSRMVKALKYLFAHPELMDA